MPSNPKFSFWVPMYTPKAGSDGSGSVWFRFQRFHWSIRFRQFRFETVRLTVTQFSSEASCNLCLVHTCQTSPLGLPRVQAAETCNLSLESLFTPLPYCLFIERSVRALHQVSRMWCEQEHGALLLPVVAKVVLGPCLGAYRLGRL